MLAHYLAAEQHLGRIRSDVDVAQLAIVLLAALFGLALNRTNQPGSNDKELIRAAVTFTLNGVAGQLPRHPQPVSGQEGNAPQPYIG